MDYREMIGADLIEQLRANYARQLPVKGTRKEIDFKPVVLLRVPFTQCLWLLTELDDEDVAFGGAQISDWELGSTWLPELMLVNVGGLKVCRDMGWSADRTLRGYCDLARASGGLLTI